MKIGLEKTLYGLVRYDRCSGHLMLPCWRYLPASLIGICEFGLFLCRAPAKTPGLLTPTLCDVSETFALMSTAARQRVADAPDHSCLYLGPGFTR